MKELKRLAVLLVFLLLTMSVHGQEKPAAKTKEVASKSKASEAKELSGISIVGNKEAPKSLFIVPWKSSELGVETGLTSSLLNEQLTPVDKDVFTRELDFYSITADK